MSLSIEWLLFLPAIILLWFPADLLLAAQVKLRSLDCFSDPHNPTPRRPWWWVPALWLDPVRGFGGAWLLMRALGLNSISWESMPKVEFVILLGVLLATAMSQTFTRRDVGVLLAPVGFVCGVVVALVPGYSPFFGLACAFIGMTAFRQFYAFFAIGVFALPLFGVLLGAAPAMIGAAALMFLFPLLTGMLTNSVLEMPTHYEGDT